MKPIWLIVAGLALFQSCIAPSVVAHEDRAISLGSAEIEWRPAVASELPGTYVSTELTGQLAVALRKLVYLFESGGTYTGAVLIEDGSAHFEVINGRWRLEPDALYLDDGPPATLLVAPDGSLQLSGAEGRVVLRREQAQ